MPGDNLLPAIILTTAVALATTYIIAGWIPLAILGAAVLYWTLRGE